ncbi:MAG: YciI family protein [Planctomycetota bacterium]
MNKYMLIYRSPVSNEQAQPSPEEMQEMFKQWDAWKEKFKANILDMGDGLKPEGRVLSAENQVTDGPFVEAKEVLGGGSLISAENFEQALEVSRECPVRHMPGNSIEIRELAGY